MRRNKDFDWIYRSLNDFWQKLDGIGVVYAARRLQEMMNKNTIKKFIWFLPVVTRNFKLSTRTPKFISILLFWTALVSAWLLWESNQRHVLRQLQVLFCPREQPVWTVPDLCIFGANWCKRCKTPFLRIIVDHHSSKLLIASVGNEPLSLATILHLQYVLTTATRQQCTMLRNYASCNQTH